MRKAVEIINRGIEEGLHDCAQLTVWRRGETPVDLAFGRDTFDVELTVDHNMLWMSAGKPVTAIAIMQQIERGLATLDTRVADVIPDFAQNGKSAITIKHLLTHTAGFRGPLNSFTPGSWDEIIGRCCALRQEPNWTPGEKSGYHVASSWFILGEIVRILAGRGIGEYLRDEVFARVDAPNCSVGKPADQITPMDVLVKPDFPGNTIDAMTIPRPPANARGPMKELARLYRSIIDHDGKLLSPEVSKQMIHRHRAGLFDETFKQTLDWSLGFKLDSKRYGKPEQYGYGDHASDDSFGHSGNQCACAFADPKHGVVIAWCVNGMPGEAKHQQRQHAINTAIYEDLRLA